MHQAGQIIGAYQGCHAGKDAGSVLSEGISHQEEYADWRYQHNHVNQ